mmetsp:Transcript_75892/g.195555  ORF Transcript_75892/g.195555 Transcript_75892/m.195555 type:complete len:259 (-) Transcript_75892:718-1494(-)
MSWGGWTQPSDTRRSARSAFSEASSVRQLRSASAVQRSLRSLVRSWLNCERVLLQAATSLRSEASTRWRRVERLSSNRLSTCSTSFVRSVTRRWTCAPAPRASSPRGFRCSVASSTSACDRCCARSTARRPMSRCAPSATRRISSSAVRSAATSVAAAPSISRAPASPPTPAASCGAVRLTPSSLRSRSSKRRDTVIARASIIVSAPARCSFCERSCSTSWRSRSASRRSSPRSWFATDSSAAVTSWMLRASSAVLRP